jgi:hypothetical protein
MTGREGTMKGRRSARVNCARKTRAPLSNQPETEAAPDGPSASCSIELHEFCRYEGCPCRCHQGRRQ